MISNEEERASQLPPNAPPLPDDVREAARLAPDHWLGVVDPGWRGEGPPPHWAVVGEWRSGLSGEVEEWQPNEEYRPSPASLGWPEPTDPVDAAVQAAVTGYGPLVEAVRALAGAEISFLRTRDGVPQQLTSPDGTPTVPVFTSAAHQPFALSLTHATLPATALATHGVTLTVNPAGPACLVVTAEEVLEAAATAEAASGSGSAYGSAVGGAE
ncbi:type VII secretion system-associated protein [Streptomyces sp. 351MFTsu5.1]|uniref:type VII secretion system-associated protein n=1 Tax=Streptomyces sp. 351MFTsu5.1 TaxID=1172180 RepID=UPI00035DE6C6|nr:type VII secretion system-associated protein [Streptomyces sp. 351MFTsu5.1]